MTELRVAHTSLRFQLGGRSPQVVLAGCLTLTGVAAGVARTRARVNRKRNALRQIPRRRFEQELSFEAIGRQLRAVYEALVSRR